MRCAFRSILLMLSASISAATCLANASHILQPTAMSITNSGSVVILDKSQRVVVVPPGPDLQHYQVLFTIDPAWEPLDISCSGLDDAQRIFVTVAQGTFGMLLEYSGSGKWLNSWPQSTILSGLAIDSQNQRVFIAGALTGNIYSYSWNDRSPNPIKTFTHIPDANTLGALAIDSRHPILYSSDVGSGSIVSIDLDSKTVHGVAERVGQPAALAVSSSSNRLYIADSAGRRIWAVSLDAKSMKARLFSPPSEFAKSPFRQPSALAVDSHGVVWVGDPDAKAFFQLAASGNIFATYKIVFE